MFNRLLRIQKLSVFLTCVGLALTLVQRPASAHARDLDALSDEEIEADLDKEASDEHLKECGLTDRNALLPLDELERVILCVLRDDEDENNEDENDEDENDTEIDWEDLENEMKEAHTSVESVVRHALIEADDTDDSASRQRSLSATFARVNFARDRQIPEFSHSILGPLAMRDGRESFNQGWPPTKRALRNTIRQARSSTP